MKTIISNDIKVEGYSQELLWWCDFNLVLSNPEYYRAKAMGRWYKHLDEQLYLYEKRGDTLVLPFGTLRDIWHFISEGEIFTDFPEPRINNMKGDIDLYPYQVEARDVLVNKRSGILESPPGSGKTQIGLSVIHKLGMKALWITHTRDLLTQSMLRAEMYFKGDFGTITDGKVNIGQDITFATVQTLSKLDLWQYRNEWDVIIVDECHKVAGTPTKLMMFYKVLTNLNCRYKYGLSATLKRADNMIKSTYSVLGNIVHKITKEEVGDKIIKAKHEAVYSNTPESIQYLETDGRVNNIKLINYLVEDENRNDFIASLVDENEITLVLSHRVEHCYRLQKAVGFGEVVVGEINKNERKRIFEETRNGENRVIFSTYLLAREGLDVPNLTRLILATPQKDFVTTKQSVGRIERNIKGKKQPIVFDVVDKNIGTCLKMYKKRVSILKK